MTVGYKSSDSAGIPSTVGRAASVPGEFVMSPYERIEPPAELDGRTGSRRIREGCKIDADSDFGAIRIWVERASSDATRRARRSLAERLLNWAYLELRKAVSSFDPEEFGAFIDFAASPEPSNQWIAQRGCARDSLEWRPFSGSMSPATQEATASHLSSLLTYLRKQNYANLQFASGKRQAREGIADSSLAYLCASSERRVEPISLAEWHWICRWMDDVGRTSDDLVLRLIVELLYYGRLKLTEVAALSKAELWLPPMLGGPWRLVLQNRAGNAVREVRFLPRQLTGTLIKWFGNGAVLNWHAFERGDPLLNLTADAVAALLRQVFDGASLLAEEREDFVSAERLHRRTAMSLRHAWAIHEPVDPLQCAAYLATLELGDDAHTSSGCE